MRSQPAIFSMSRKIVKWNTRVQAIWMILQQHTARYYITKMDLYPVDKGCIYKWCVESPDYSSPEFCWVVSGLHLFYFRLAYGGGGDKGQVSRVEGGRGKGGSSNGNLAMKKHRNRNRIDMDMDMDTDKIQTRTQTYIRVNIQKQRYRHI